MTFKKNLVSNKKKDKKVHSIQVIIYLFIKFHRSRFSSYGANNNKHRNFRIYYTY